MLKAAEQSGFQVMLTGDKNLSYQQNLKGGVLALVVLPTIDWIVLRRSPATLAAIVAAVDRAIVGSFERLESGTESVPKRTGRAPKPEKL